MFKLWLENNLKDLYTSTVAAFPTTKKRQHSTDLVKITELSWVPYLGVKTLFVKGLAQSGESGKEYTPVILFKGVNYLEFKGNNVSLTANDGQLYFLERIDSEANDILLKCDCADYKWRFHHFNYIDHSHYGRDRKPYTALINPGSANPSEASGMCKHLMKMMKAIQEAGILK